MRSPENQGKSSGVHRPLTFLNSFWSFDPGLVGMFHEPLAFGAVSTDSALLPVGCIQEPLVVFGEAFEPCFEVFDPVYYFIHVVSFIESL